ncbi:MAG: hypothetical protein AAF430_17620 [Myxococcota bacterium]
MTPTRWTWAVLLGAYALFCGWYTSCGGPLTEVEIDAYVARMQDREPPLPPERLERLRRFLEEDTGDDFVMVNLIDMYETPLAVEGVEPGETSDEVMDKYMAFMTPELAKRASHPVLYGQAANTAMDLMNADGMERWSVGAGMRYRSRRDLMEIATNPDFDGAHHFKVAAMAKTIAFPIDPWLQLGDPRLVLGLLFAALGSALSWFWALRSR